MRLSLVILFLCSVCQGQLPEGFMARLEARESGGRNVAGKNGERGICQIRKISWDDTNRWRKSVGLSVRPFSDAWNPTINREFGRQFAEIQQRRLRVYLRREPTEKEIYEAFNRGFEGFKRKGRK